MSVQDTTGATVAGSGSLMHPFADHLGNAGPVFEVVGHALVEVSNEGTHRGAPM